MKRHYQLIPKIFIVFEEGYSWQGFQRDCVAGFVVGIVALPLALAFAIASGVKPEQGLYTAIVAGFLISFLSGSRVQIGGPTGAFIVIIYGIVQQFGYQGLAMATLMAGGMLIIMGLARLGQIIEFIPYPVTVGFTSGIAVIILTTQLRDFLGLPINMPADLVGKIQIIGSHLAMVNPWSLLLGLLTIVLIFQWPKFVKQIPGSLIAIIATVFLVRFFHLPVETVQTRFGAVPNSLPHFQFPVCPRSMIPELIRPAAAIAFLAGFESLLSAIVADGMTGFRHRPNMELIAQGVANIGSIFFGGIPATGAIARTATNIKNGGRTPVAGIVHTLTLLAILLLFGSWASLIPMTTLAAILVVVAYNMSEWRMFLKLFKSPKSDIVVLLTTFSLTIFVDLIAAIEVGVVMAAFLFMKRMVNATEIVSIKQTFDPDDDESGAAVHSKIPSGVEIFEINGPFFFGAADKFKTVLRDVNKRCSVLILDMRNVPILDATGLRAFEDICDKSKKDGIIILISGIKNQPREILQVAGLDVKIGRDHILSTIEQALEKAKDFVVTAKTRKPVAGLRDND